MSDFVLTEERKNVLFKIVAYAVFISFAILTIFPLVWLFYSSFKPKLEILRHGLALPKNPTLQNYVRAWELGHLGEYAINSLIYTFFSTGGVIILSMMASFAFAKLKIRYKITPILYNLFLGGLLITLHAILIPLFLFETRIGLQDTYLGLILPYIAIGLPFAIYLGTEFIKGIPDSIIESAKIDGASYLQVFLKIILPISKPIIVTLTILSVLGAWNEFLLAFILTSLKRSLPVGIYMFSGPLAIEYGMQFAALVIGLAPVLLFYALFSKQITRGLTVGAIKG